MKWRFFPIVTLFVAASAVAQTTATMSPALSPAQRTPIQVAAQPQYETIKFAAEVPKAPDELPVLLLVPQPPPTDMVNRFLGGANAAGRLTPLSEAPFIREHQVKVPETILGVVEGEHVRAWVDTRSGDAAIYPTLSKISPSAALGVREAAARAQQLFDMPELIARDDTKFVVDKPRLLNGATLVRENNTTRVERAPAPYLAYVSARRLVRGFPVYGPGSRALLVFNGDGGVEGLTRVWKAGKTADMVRPTHSAEQVRAEILQQLRPASRGSDIVVDSIIVAYYDGNRAFLQPVYRFTARVHHRGENIRTSDDFVIGYVPIARELEPLPLLGHTDGPSPTTPAKLAAPARTMSPGGAADPIVGRYVVRNDDSGWVNDANAFWSSLASGWTSFLFTNSQYYWAEPRLFTSEKNSFINAMNLALIEVHGDWWLYSTLKNCCDLVNINGDIPSPGYGPSASGKLADWIIHSCEVVPAPDDTAQWPDPWWTVFGGVRNVVGYRTIMYISDGAGGPYGVSVANLAPVVSSWLSDVISLNAYSGHPSTPAHGGINRPMGRPSTISMCGHDGDSVLATSSLGRANCLTVWWFPD